MNIPDLIDREQLPWSLLQKGWASPNDAQHEQVMLFADALNDLHRKRVEEAVTACRPQLRPIAEMPEDVPEGCVRLYGGIYGFRWLTIGMDADKSENDTHYIDIALPADTYPPEFEQAWEQHGKPEPKSAAFKLWKGGER